MILLTAIIVGVIFAASVYLLLGSELKEICMGIFLLGHGANLAIIASSGSPLGKVPPVLGQVVSSGRSLAEQYVDPLPQALVLTAIVIGFAVQAFLLTMIVVTHRRARTIDVKQLAHDGKEQPNGR